MNGEHALAQLRHLYAQMLSGNVKDCETAAHGLLGPAIEALEVERRRIAALEKERDAALADNAALLEQLRFWEKALEDVVANGGGADLGWMDEGEATAMLAVIRASHSGAALLEEHRKALVRARNEGLREADAKILKTAESPAYFREHHPERAEYVAVLGGYSVGVNHALDTIRAMLTPESD